MHFAIKHTLNMMCSETLIRAFIYLLIGACVAAENKYVGKKIGKFNSYHHQVGGEVYAVDEHTFLIKDFTYDGIARDAFFWAGSKPQGRPGPLGFIVPDEKGRTNVLGPYLNKDITIKLPNDKTIRDINWLAVFDISRLQSFGDIAISEGFEAPSQVILNKFTSRTGKVISGPITIKDSKNIAIENLKFNGTGLEAYFWVGVGAQPHTKGDKVPDEYGYMTPLAVYDGSTISLELPGDKTVFTVDWLAVYDLNNTEILGYLIIPDELNVPPSLVTIIPHETTLPNCEQLYKDLQVGWEVFGNDVTIEIAAQVDENDYVAFGMSGDPVEPKMVGADVVVAYIDGYSSNLIDYNITTYMPCTQILGQHKGVCPDSKVGGQDNYQTQGTKRENGINIFIFRRPLITPDTGDTAYPSKGEAMIVWALGALDEIKNPTMHYAWARTAQPLEFARKPGKNNCYPFTQSPKIKHASWGTTRLVDPAKTNFTAQLGPDGGPKGYTAITGVPSENGLAWYIDGFLVPELYLKRNTKYTFLVEGGADPYDARRYHPLIITDEPHGGFSQLSEDQQKSVRVFAGVGYTLRGDANPTAAGRLCMWEHPEGFDRRRDGEFLTFQRYRNSLKLDCEVEKKPAMLQFTPNKTWPNTVFYNSWTGTNMGWKIHITDEINADKILAAAKAGQPGSSVLSLYLILTIITIGCLSML